MKIVVAEASGYSNEAIALYRTLGEVVCKFVGRSIAGAAGHIFWLLNCDMCRRREILAKAKVLKLLSLQPLGSIIFIFRPVVRYA